MRQPLVLRAALALLVSRAAASSSDGGDAIDAGAKKEEKCETLRTALRYAQERAPKDISAVLPVIVERMNRELSGVLDVTVDWSGGGSFHLVGRHAVRTSVTRLASLLGPDEAPAEGEEGAGDGGYGVAAVEVDEEGRRVVTQCFDVPFVVDDADECDLPKGHAMAHTCHEPSVCVNTVGGYECVCPPAPRLDGGKAAAAAAADEGYFRSLDEGGRRSPWDVSLNSTRESSCPGRASTSGCCPRDAHSADGRACRGRFRCPSDPCSRPGGGGVKRGGGGDDCAPGARCARASSPLSKPDHLCRCPRGLLGNGRACRGGGVDPVPPRPTVEFDGVTPTAETAGNLDKMCGCTKPSVDACAGFPPCEGKHEICVASASDSPSCGCKPGYVRAEGYGCIDETPPVLRLRDDPDGDGINRLKQGDAYVEHAVDVIDENAEDYLRSLKIAYSRPLPPRCLARVGEFRVNYTVATPWTSPPFVGVSRTVVIEDVDECSLDVDKYETKCPELVPRCDVDSGARCVNTHGSYTCRCPEHTSGDGFKAIATARKDERGRYVGAPVGYGGGTGCVDTSRPVIEVLGPNPRVFRACRCGGLGGLTSGSGSGGNDDGDGLGRDLVEEQRSRYGPDLRSLIKSSAGAELCATHVRPDPTPADCVRATDRTWRGDVDLTAKVRVGEPVRKSELRWSVPYDVTDGAGNAAETVWRDVAVEEVDPADLERRVRDEVLRDKEREVREATARAVEKERKRIEARVSAVTKSKREPVACPECPKCVCPEADAEWGPDQCEAICSERTEKTTGTCEIPDGSGPSAGGATSRGTAIPAESLHPAIQRTVRFAEGMLPPTLIVTLLLVSAAAVIFLILQRIVTAIFHPRDGYYYTREDEERERAMLDAVTYYRSPTSGTARQSGAANGSSGQPGSAPPRVPMSVSAGGVRSGGVVGNGLFSPAENRAVDGRLFA